MSAIVHARVLDNLARLRLAHLVECLDTLLAEAARGEPTYLDFLDSLLRGEVDSKQRKRVAMGMTIAHFPSVKTLDEFDFKSQPSIDQRLVRETASNAMATARCRTLSSKVGMPMGRVCDPSPFGIWTRRTGGARYVPDLARSSSD